MNARCTGCNNRLSIIIRKGDELSNYGCGNCCGSYERLTADIGYISYGIYFYKNRDNKYFISNASLTKWIPIGKPYETIPTIEEITSKYFSIR
jgi:hypothetical protein